MMRRSIRYALGSLALPLAVIASSAPAAASEVFPEHVAATLDVPCVPGCQLCHLTAKGGPFMTNAKFGAAMKAHGSKGGANTAQLDIALQEIETAMTDSDDDGIPDITEIRAGDDPNAAGTSLCGVGVKYGCGASTIARTPSKKSLDPAASVAGALSVLFGLLLLRRRR